MSTAEEQDERALVAAAQADPTRFLDLYDRHFHRVYAYVLRRAPEFILMGNVAVLPFPLTPDRVREKLVLKSEHELWDDPRFHAAYEFKSVRLADTGPFQYFSFYQRKPGADLPTP